MTTLEKTLTAYDGKHTEPLESFVESLAAPDPPLVDELLATADRSGERLQAAATWLLKRFLELGFAFSADQTARHLDLLDKVGHWGARLNLLQSLPCLDFPAARHPDLWRTLCGESYLAGQNKMVRAWAYNGLALIAHRDAVYRERACTILSEGTRDDAASVRARIRNIQKEFPWSALI